MHAGPSCAPKQLTRGVIAAATTPQRRALNTCNGVSPPSRGIIPPPVGTLLCATSGKPLDGSWQPAPPGASPAGAPSSCTIHGHPRPSAGEREERETHQVHITGLLLVASKLCLGHYPGPAIPSPSLKHMPSSAGAWMSSIRRLLLTSTSRNWVQLPQQQ